MTIVPFTPRCIMKFQITAAFMAASLLLLVLPANAQQAYNPQGMPVAVNYNGYQPMPVVPMQQNMGYQPMPVVPMQQNMGYQPMPVVPMQQNMGYQQSVGIPAQPVTQYYRGGQMNQPSLNQIPAGNIAQQQTSQSRVSTSPSPYEQQELALKESKMLQELENIKKSQGDAETYRKLDNFGFGSDSGNGSVAMEKGYVSKSSNSKFGRTLQGVGSVFKSGVRTLAPAATTVGTYFLIRSTY